MTEDIQSECEDHVVIRAKQALQEGNIPYAKFLCKEAITIDPQHVQAWKLLFKLKTPSDTNKAIRTAKIVCILLKLLMHNALKNYQASLYDAYNIFNISPDNNFATLQMIRIAGKAQYYKLVIAIYENDENLINEIDDLIIIAKSYLAEKIFDRAAKIAKDASVIAPDNEELKDILWKASVERHMNSDVSLVTSDNNTRFVPPKIDTEKIFISSHKDDSGKNTTKANKDPKP